MNEPISDILDRETKRLDLAFGEARQHLPINGTRKLFALAATLRQEICSRITQLPDHFDPPSLLRLQSKLHHHLDSLVERHIRHCIDELSNRAERDPLTGLRHRAGFSERLNKEVDRANRYRRSFALVLADLDNFKSVNDRFGHTTGDMLLIRFASILRDSLRQSDEAFRLGGDEFAAICPETDLTSGESVGSRLDVALKRSLTVNGMDTTCGLSWGVATLPDDASTAEELIRIADLRLYSRKSAHHLKLSAPRT